MSRPLHVRTRTGRTAGVVVATMVLVAGAPAHADHTDPSSPISPLAPQPSQPALTAGEGTWEHVGNLGPMQGTDLEPFTVRGTTYVAGGTLGQGPDGVPGFVGQRIVQLTDASGAPVQPTVVADHGSAACEQPATGVTGLQHDVQAVPRTGTELLVDTTDAVGRCHDTPGGGLEIIDVSGLGQDGFEPREIALIRLNGLSHTVTADATRPGILYNNGADFPQVVDGKTFAMTWTDVVDVRSCLGLAGLDLAAKRDRCRPEVYRIPYAPEVASKRLADGSLAEPASCHDITAGRDRLYCAGLNATWIVDVSRLLGADGKVAGRALPCTRTPAAEGGATGAALTDCALRPDGAGPSPTAQQAVTAWEAAGRPAATGARVLGTVNHPGRDCTPVPATTCNTNTVVRSDQGVAISHESDPTPDGRFMLVTDERGGGVLPPGATCAPGLDNPIGNGGLHVFDISDPARPVQAQTPDGEPAVYIGTSPTPSPVFCTIHVIEQVPGEARIVAAYYDGGTKIVDYAVDAQGRWTFEEVAAYRLPGANTWASEVFRTRDNPDGTRTYWFVSNSFALGQGTARGLDVFTWTGPPNPLRPAAAPAPSSPPPASGGGPPPPQSAPAPAPGTLPATGPDAALLALALLLLPLAFAVRRYRGRLTTG